MVTDGPYAEAEEVLAGLLDRRMRQLRPGHRGRRTASPIAPGPSMSRARAFADVRPIDEHQRGLRGLSPESWRVTAPAPRTCCVGSAPQVLGALVRRYGNFDLAEDATQEALLAAAMQWPRDGLPENPRAWLITVASRRLTDLLRSDQARRRREETVAAVGTGRDAAASWRGTPIGRRRRHPHLAVHVLPPRRCPLRRRSC